MEIQDTLPWRWEHIERLFSLGIMLKVADWIREYIPQGVSYAVDARVIDILFNLMKLLQLASDNDQFPNGTVAASKTEEHNLSVEGFLMDTSNAVSRSPRLRVSRDSATAARSSGETCQANHQFPWSDVKS